MISILVLDPITDRSEDRQYSPNAHKVLSEIIEGADLIDIWRLQHPTEKRFSWTRKSRKGITGSRIDFALVNSGLANMIDCSNYSYGYKSDHSLMTVKIVFREERRGPGYWKFKQTIIIR